MLCVGLTGGLASGKSTVAACFRDLGARHIDADAIAHALLAPGGGAEREVVERFGPSIVGPEGAIDRKALAAIVFHDRRALQDLNALVHPKVKAEIARAIARLSSEGGAVALVDAALLVESGIHLDLDALIVVGCDEATQVARAVTRGGLTEDQARARIASQAPLSEKMAVADFVIDNGGSIEETERQVRAVWNELRGHSPIPSHAPRRRGRRR